MILNCAHTSKAIRVSFDPKYNQSARTQNTLQTSNNNRKVHFKSMQEILFMEAQKTIKKGKVVCAQKHIKVINVKVYFGV